MQRYAIQPKKVLVTDKTDPELSLLKLPDDVVEASYAKNASCDLHTLSLPDRDFDFVLFSQTLEYL